jgi:hypothetical protein
MSGSQSDVPHPVVSRGDRSPMPRHVERAGGPLPPDPVACVLCRVAFEPQPAVIGGEANRSVQRSKRARIDRRWPIGDFDRVLQLVAERADLTGRRLPALDLDAEIPPRPPASDEGQPAAQISRQHARLDIDEDCGSIQATDKRPEQGRSARALADQGAQFRIESPHVRSGPYVVFKVSSASGGAAGWGREGQRHERDADARTPWSVRRAGSSVHGDIGARGGPDTLARATIHQSRAVYLGVCFQPFKIAGRPHVNKT